MNGPGPEMAGGPAMSSCAGTRGRAAWRRELRRELIAGPPAIAGPGPFRNRLGPGDPGPRRSAETTERAKECSRIAGMCVCACVHVCVCVCVCVRLAANLRIARV